MTVEELRAEAEKLGYYITKKKPSNKGAGHKCRECVWLDMSEKCCIGYKCANPNKSFYNNTTARFKYGHTPACRLFVDKGEEK